MGASSTLLMGSFQRFANREVIGFLERVICIAKDGSRKIVKARIDTGATKSSIDQSLVEEMGWGPILGEKRIRNAHGYSLRQIVDGKIILAQKEITEHFNIANREHMTYPILIGRNVLRRGFLIDPNKKVSKIEEK